MLAHREDSLQFRSWWSNLIQCGPKHEYHPQLKENDISGAVIGSEEKKRYVHVAVEKWMNEVHICFRKLQTTQPQVAYSDTLLGISIS